MWKCLFCNLQVAGSQTLKESGKPVKVAESDVDVSPRITDVFLNLATLTFYLSPFVFPVAIVRIHTAAILLFCHAQGGNGVERNQS